VTYKHVTAADVASAAGTSQQKDPNSLTSYTCIQQTKR